MFPQRKKRPEDRLPLDFKFRYSQAVRPDRKKLVICTAAFVAVMILFRFLWGWFVYQHGASWIEVGAFIGAMLVIGAMIDRRDRQRDNVG